MQREEAAERILKLQQNWAARQSLDEQLTMKKEFKKVKQNENDIERQLLEQHDEKLKKMDENQKKMKLQDEQIQKEFLQVLKVH